jgi:peptide deformylase
MKKEKIVIFGEPVLRESAQPVTVFHKKLHALVDTMKNTLLSAENAAALAANQIGVLKRIIVINYMDEYFEMLNPEILSLSEESVVDSEGCLSLPGYNGNVRRALEVKAKFQDRYGKEIIVEASGPMARCIQHEIDHLNGILYIDRMEEQFVTDDNDKLSVEELLKKTPRKRPII